MTAAAALKRPPARPPRADGGGPARRAVVRWAWRLFRREWRQQILVLALLTVAVAATTAGVCVATNAAEVGETTFVLPGSDAQLAADVAALEQAFGPADVVAHQRIAVPGSLDTIDLRAEDPARTVGHPALRLLAGRYPAGAGEVAVTRRVAKMFDLRIGGSWALDGRTRAVVGLVENPRHLGERFALVAPGQADPPATVSVRLDGDRRVGRFRLPSGAPLSVEMRSATAKSAAAAAVLALATMGLLFVGLVAVAGFAVMAQRRLRALGMLGSLGATDGHIRLVMLADGAAVGAVAAVAGAAAGLAGWLAVAPSVETAVGHRIDRLAVPWWATGAAMALAVTTAVVAAWWPARAAARIPVVAALSGRPPRPRPGHRFAAVGGLLLAGGLVLLGLAHQRRPLLTVAGTVGTTLGVLLLAPLAIRALAAAGRWSPVAVRLALRDLARYRSRSGATLGAVALAVGMAATITVSAAAQRRAEAGTGGNLPADALVAYVADGGGSMLLPELTAAQLRAAQAGVDDIVAAVGARAAIALEEAVDPADPQQPGLGTRPGGNGVAALVQVEAVPGGTNVRLVAVPYVATPEVLAHYGVRPGEVDPAADILTSRTDLGGLLLASAPRRRSEPAVRSAPLPAYTSAPNTLITAHAVEALGLQTRPAAWLVETARPLTPAQVDAAGKIAAGVGLTVETPDAGRTLDALGRGATAAGIVLALGVLAMTVGLIRSETAGDLRILTATGAGAATRRTVTAATAGALALLGALLGTAGAYLALVAWHRADLAVLGRPPVPGLLLILVGLPVVAAAGGWVLAGREPSGMARTPLE